jgi:hypothetical protein
LPTSSLDFLSYLAIACLLLLQYIIAFCSIDLLKILQRRIGTGQRAAISVGISKLFALVFMCPFNV